MGVRVVVGCSQCDYCRVCADELRVDAGIVERRSNSTAEMLHKHTTVYTGSSNLSGSGLEVKYENMVVRRGGESSDKSNANFASETAASSPKCFF